MDLTNLRNIHQQNEATAVSQRRHDELLLDNAKTQEVFVTAISRLVDFLDNKVTKTEVINQLREIGTPDVQNVVTALDSLHNTLKQHENTDLTEITGVMRGVLDEVKQIPKEKVEIDLPEQKDYVAQFNDLAKTLQAIEEAIKAQKLNVEAPVVNVPETVVKVDKPDLKPLEKSITTNSKNVVKAVKGIKIPELNTDPIEKLLKKTNKLLEELPDYMPTGGGSGSSWVATNSEGTPVPLELESDGSIPVTIKNPDDIGGGTTAINYLIKNISPSDDPEIATYKYFGYIESGGTNWRIMRKTLATNAFDYATGTSDYATAWTNKDSQSYS